MSQRGKGREMVREVIKTERILGDWKNEPRYKTFSSISLTGQYHY